MHPELTAHMRDAGRSSMKKWRKDETDFMLVEAALDGRGWSGGVDAQRLVHVAVAGQAAADPLRARGSWAFGSRPCPMRPGLR